MSYSTPHKKYGAIVFAAVVAIAVSFIFATKGTLDRRATLSAAVKSARQARLAGDVAACRRINKLDHLIQQQLMLQQVTTPKLAYYKEHPDELKAVLANLNSEIAAFAPEKC